MVFEISGDVPPTNTKLLGLNDVTFSVNTDSASVVETVTTTSNAWSFDGSNDYVQLPSLSTGYEFAVSMWVKLDSAGVDNHFFMDNGSWTTSGIWLQDRSGTMNGLRVGPVSYTHLTLPTIYSV